jgi:hypothetical protein
LPYIGFIETEQANDQDRSQGFRPLNQESSGKVPCYAINGKRVAFKWVSIGSSCVIGRGEAERMLARVGVDINEVEAA